MSQCAIRLREGILTRYERGAGISTQQRTLNAPSLPNIASSEDADTAASGVVSPPTAAYVALSSSFLSSLSWLRSSFTLSTLSRSLENARLRVYMAFEKTYATLWESELHDG